MLTEVFVAITDKRVGIVRQRKTDHPDRMTNETSPADEDAIRATWQLKKLSIMSLKANWFDYKNDMDQRLST